MDWHGPHGLPKRRPEPDPGAWLSWVALAGIGGLITLAAWIGMR